MNKYLAKIIANDQEGLQMISAYSSGAKVKVADEEHGRNSRQTLIWSHGAPVWCSKYCKGTDIDRDFL